MLQFLLWKWGQTVLPSWSGCRIKGVNLCQSLRRMPGTKEVLCPFAIIVSITWSSVILQNSPSIPLSVFSLLLYGFQPTVASLLPCNSFPPSSSSSMSFFMMFRLEIFHLKCTSGLESDWSYIQMELSSAKARVNKTIDNLNHSTCPISKNQKLGTRNVITKM